MSVRMMGVSISSFAYAIVALLLGLGFLFPERPFSWLDFAIIAAALTLVVGGFDVLGQSIIDAPGLKVVIR